MKKITYLLLLISSMVFGQFPAPYCGPITFTTNVEPITLVNFAGINNATIETVGAANSPAHEDFTAIVGNVDSGSTYTITLKGNTDGNFTNRFMVFIDWNQDGDFADANEATTVTQTILNSTGVDAIQATHLINVPPTALAGNTRMRVKKIFGTTNYVDPCLGAGYGQIEEYTINVTVIAPCLTGFNSPTATIIPSNCDGLTSNLVSNGSWAGDYFTVSVTSGQTYKFLSSVATDYYTISTDDGATATASGTQPLNWVSTVTGDIRVFINTDSTCGTEDADRTTSILCGNLCLAGTLYPAATLDITTCDGTTVNELTTDSYAGEYTNVNVFASNSYTFSSSIATDYITIASTDGLMALAVGTGSVDFTPTTDGVIRVYFHSNASCGTEAVDRSKNVVCSTALTVPDCASNPSPMDMAIDIPVGPIELTWDIPTTGDAPTSYDLYAGDTATTLAFVGNYTTNTSGTDLNLNTYGVTIFWQIVPKNGAGAATGCDVWSFTTIDSPGYCLTAPNGQYPADAFDTTTCDGLTENVIVTDAWTGEYSTVNVIEGESYIFNSGTTDFITLSTDDGVTAAAYGVTPLSWVSTVTGVVNFYSHNDDQCGSEAINRTRSIICGTPPADSPDYVSLQWPPTATIAQGGSTTVYGQVYEAGLTDTTMGQAPGINVWVGVSTTDTNPNTWTNWTAATFNTEVDNNDEYQATIGAAQVPGTYYYATRFNLNGGAYVYGGINQAAPNNGNFWDGTTFVNGILTVTAPVAPANDDCSGAIALTAGGTFDTNPVTGTILAATTTAGITPSCQASFGFDVWYTVDVPASGNITIETKGSAANSMTDSVVAAFTGACGTLTQIGCNDDDGDGNMSLLVLTGLNPLETLHIAVWKWNTPAPTGTNSGFRIAAYDGSLSNGSFDNASFTYYPNPVKNTLNLSYSDTISNVEVYNLLGQQMTSKSFDATTAQIDMSSYTSGVYLVKVTSNNTTKTVRVIKE